MKKFLAFLLTAMMVFAMAACSTEEPAAPATDEGGEAAAEGNMVVGLSVSTLNNPFFVTLKEGAEAKAAEAGVELIVLDAGDDSAKQTNDIDDLISKNISVLIVNPVDSDAVAPAVEDAMAKGIQVVAVDRMVNGVDIEIGRAHV